MSTDSRTDVCDKLWATLPPILFWDTVLDQDKRNTCSSRSRTGPRSSTRLPPALDRSLHYTESQLMGREPDGVEADRYISSCPPPESSGRSQACRLPLGSKMPTRDCLQTVSASSSGIYYFPRPEIDSGTQGRPLPKCYSRSGVPGHTMDGNARNRAGEDTDLRCVEVSALGTSAAFPQSCRGNLEEPGSPRCENIQEQTTEDFLAALLLKTDTYRPRQESLLRMRNESFLNMRTAVVNWFASVCESYKFANETVLAAVSNFDRYVAVRVEAVGDHMLLQLMAYVSLLVASKMSETVPLQMKSLGSLTGRMFTPIQVKRCEMDMLCKLQFRLAPPSTDETFICLSALVHKSCTPGISVKDVQSTGSYYLKKARTRTCWFRHSPYTLAVAALATTYNSLGFGQLRRRLLRECDARARGVTGRGVDILGVASCAEVMSRVERAAATTTAAAAVAARTARRNGRWGSPTGVAHGAELLREVAFSTGSTDSHPVVTPSPPKPVGPCAVPKPAWTGGVPVSSVSAVASRAPLLRGVLEVQQQGCQKRHLPQSSRSCFEPCSRRARIDDVGGQFGVWSAYPRRSNGQAN